MAKTALLTEDGLDRDTAIGVAARTFHTIVGGEQPTDDETLTVLWGSVVARAHTLLGEGDEEISYAPHQLADMLRKAYARALEVEAIPFANLSAKVRFGWEGVARVLFALFAAADDQLREIEAVEAAVVESMRAKIAAA